MHKLHALLHAALQRCADALAPMPETTICAHVVGEQEQYGVYRDDYHLTYIFKRTASGRPVCKAFASRDIYRDKIRLQPFWATIVVPWLHGAIPDHQLALMVNQPLPARRDRPVLRVVEGS